MFFLRRIGGKEDNDSYTPRLRRIEMEAQILWMDSGWNEGWLRQNRSEQWLKNEDLQTLWIERREWWWCFFPDFGNYSAFMTFSKLLYWLSIRYELVKGDLGDARRFYNGPKSHLWCSEIRLYEPNLNFQAKFSILKPLQQWDSWTQKTIRTIKNRTIYQTSQLPILIIRHLQNRLFNGDAFPKSGKKEKS